MPLTARRALLGGLTAVLVDNAPIQEPPERVVVLCHGFGAPGDDLVGLTPELELPPRTRLVFPAAPLALADFGWGEARAWWPLDVERIQAALARGAERDPTLESPPELPGARQALCRFLDALDAPAPLYLGGFSQGAMLALDVALHDARPLAGLILMSGTFLAEPEWRPRMAARKGLRVLMSHGEQDPLLPHGVSLRLRDALVEAGLDVTWMSFRGAHEIPRQVVAALGGFLA